MRKLALMLCRKNYVHCMGFQPSCKDFADPHVQHDITTLLLDLILLKRDVYRHLLFNRGTGAKMVCDAVGTKSSLQQEKEENVKGQQESTENDREVVSFPFSPLRITGLQFTQARWKLIMRLGAALIWVDACMFLTPLDRKTND